MKLWRVGEVQGAGPDLDGHGGMSLKMKGKIYSACVHGTVVYCSETQQLVRAERMMARLMCGVSLRDNKESV